MLWHHGRTFCVNNIFDSDCDTMQRTPILFWNLIQNFGLC